MALTLRRLLSSATRRHLSTSSASASVVPRLFGGMPLTSGGGPETCEKAMATFEAWHRALETMDGTLLRPHVHDACEFRPPTYFKPWEGGDEFVMLIDTVAKVFGPSFTYTRQFLSDDGRDWALEFHADIAETGKRLEGIDMVRLDEDGKIVDFAVLARPPNAVAALKDEMMRRVPPRLAALKVKQAASALNPFA